MLWRVQLRNTATQLLATAAAGLGAKVQSSRDTPAMSGAMPWLVVYADDHKEGQYGSPPQFLTRGRVTIEIRAEAPPTPAPAPPQSTAEALLDSLCELVETTLLGTQGLSVSCAVAPGSTTVTPSSLAGLIAGMKFGGGPIGPDNYIASIDAEAGTFELQCPYKGPTAGTFTFLIGSFVGLFEKIETFNTDTDDGTVENKNHVFSAVIEIVGHTHEIFEPAMASAVPLNGINLYVDCVNVFDASGVYTPGTGPGQEPFDGLPAARQSGPDGRPEIGQSIDIPQE